VSDYYLTRNEQFSSHIVARSSYIQLHNDDGRFISIMLGDGNVGPPEHIMFMFSLHK